MDAGEADSRTTDDVASIASSEVEVAGNDAAEVISAPISLAGELISSIEELEKISAPCWTGSTDVDVEASSSVVVGSMSEVAERSAGVDETTGRSDRIT